MQLVEFGRGKAVMHENRRLVIITEKRNSRSNEECFVELRILQACHLEIEMIRILSSITSVAAPYRRRLLR
jgi:hypothetical protein